MSDFTMIVTNAGREALVNAANTGTAPVTIAEAGLSATALAPTPATAALPGEIKRIATLSGDVVDDDTIHLIVRDESTDQFTLRSLALYLQDGTLFAVYGQATPIMEKSAQSMLLLALDLRFADIDAAALSFGDANFLNPPATTEIKGVVELATDAEATTGTDTQRAVTPKALKTAVTSWLDARFGAGAPSAFVKSLLTAASAIAFRAALSIKSAALKDEGAGNGLDADLLDGQHASAFITQNTGTRPIAYNNGTGALTIKASIGPWEIRYNFSGSAGTELGGVGAYGSADTLNYLYLGPSYTSANAFRAYPTYPAWGTNLIWHAGNDGAGSGLDADLLDGYQASAFARLGINVAFRDIIADKGDGSGAIFFGAPENQKYLFFDGTAYYLRDAELFVNSARAWHAGNDGAGSGLDADLLDGQHSSAFAQLSGATFTGPVAFSANTSFGDSNWSRYLSNGNPIDLFDTNDYVLFSRATNAWSWNVAGLARMSLSGAGNLQVTGTVYAAGTITRAGNLVWDAGNDGAGSGLDADTVDGRHASEFALLSGADFTGTINLPLGSAYCMGGGALLSKTSNGATVFITGGNTNTIFQNAARTTSLLTLSDSGTLTVSGAITRGGNLVWDAGNDGAGSGLDADLLDGQHGSYYLPAASYTAADVLTKLKTVDGAGSGLDADLLDGLEAAAFIRQNYGERPISHNNSSGDLLLKGSIGGWAFGLTFLGSGDTNLGAFGALGSGDSLSYYYVGPTHTATNALRVYPDRPAWGTNTIWHAGNDGAGSGLDADLLDGQHGSYYLPAAGYTAADVLAKLNTVDGAGSGLDADLLDGHQGSAYRRLVASSLVENGGYIKYSDGFVECWGYADIPANTTGMTINLPIAHTSWVNPNVSGGLAINNADENYAAVTGIVGAPPTGFTVSNSYQTGHRFYWTTRGV